MTPPTVTTDRLTIRPLRIDDAAALHALYGDAEALTYSSRPAAPDPAARRAQLAERLANSSWRAWAITMTGDDTAIGTLGACEQRQGGVFELGYTLVRSEWGRGYATEAVGALVDRLFAEGARRVFADTDPDNAASNRLLERLGFTLEGRLRGAWKTHIGVRDSLIWGRLANDPAPVSARPVPPRG